MKKWSISLIVAAGLLVAAFAVPASAGAAGPYCPGPNPGEQYKPCETPPKETPPKETPKTCGAGQVGTFPNCVTPVVELNEVKVKPNSSTLTLQVNAPGKITVSGKGIVATTISVSPGKVKIKVKLTPKEKAKLKEKGKLVINVKITYTPTGGTPTTKTIKVTLKSPKSKSHK